MAVCSGCLHYHAVTNVSLWVLACTRSYSACDMHIVCVASAVHSLIKAGSNPRAFRANSYKSLAPAKHDMTPFRCHALIAHSGNDALSLVTTPTLCSRGWRHCKKRQQTYSAIMWEGQALTLGLATCSSR